MKQSTASGEADFKPRKSSIDALGGAHREAVSQAIFNVLSTKIAEFTYAQIVDGLPLADVVEDVYGGSSMYPDHPVFAHTDLKHGVLDTVRSFRAAFDPRILEFDASVSQTVSIPARVCTDS